LIKQPGWKAEHEDTRAPVCKVDVGVEIAGQHLARVMLEIAP